MWLGNTEIAFEMESVFDILSVPWVFITGIAFVCLCSILFVVLLKFLVTSLGPGQAFSCSSLCLTHTLYLFIRLFVFFRNGVIKTLARGSNF
jgi:hypothetical protein